MPQVPGIRPFDECNLSAAELSWLLSTAGASILGFGMLIPAIYLVWSMRYGKRAEANPWHLPGLEWRTQSPPPTENFETTPIVTWEAYEFAPPEEMEVIGRRK